MVLSKRSLIHSDSFQPKIKSYLKLLWIQCVSKNWNIIIYILFER
jgi:hypothetical protein